MRAEFLRVDLLARFTSLAFGQFGPTFSDRRDWVGTFVPAGCTTFAFRLVAGTFLVQVNTSQ